LAASGPVAILSALEHAGTLRQNANAMLLKRKVIDFINSLKLLQIAVGRGGGIFHQLNQ
jgi:hypothetical protein